MAWSPSTWGRRVRLLGLLGLLFGLAGGLVAQTPDKLAFDAALRTYETGLWERAVSEFTEFANKFPRSALRPEAEQRRLFAQAEADFTRADYAAAANGFSAYQLAYGAEPRAAQAAVREAEARLQGGDAVAALAALTTPERPFVQALALGNQPAVLFRGLLARAEAFEATAKPAEAEAALVEAEKFAQTAEEKWHRLRRLARLKDKAGQGDLATAAAGQLLALVNGEPRLAARRAETASYVGQLQLRHGKLAEAAAAFQQNLAAEVPLEFRREATLSLAELDQGRGDFTVARQRLEVFLTSQPGDPELPTVRLKLGQILFRQYQAQRGASNAAPEVAALLTLAAGHFNAALTNNPPPAVRGALQLGLGWCQWEDAAAVKNLDRMREAETNFVAAAASLPAGVDQAVARFKVGDCLAFRQDWAGAMTNFLSVARDYGAFPEAKSLAEPALQQAVLSATQAGDPATAQLAMAGLLELNPLGEPAARSALLVGQSLSMHGRDEEATELLRRYLAKFPASPLRPDIELTLAASHLRGGDWTNAVSSLNAWLTTYTNHPSRPRAEFDRWFAEVEGGLTTNAVEQVIALAARYPGNPNLLTAQLWLADTFYSSGDFARAELACLSVVTNSIWRGSDGWYHAKFLSAESARRRQAWGNAATNLLELLNDKSLPAALEPQAFFAYGELLLERPPVAGAAPLGHYLEALEAFKAASRLTNSPVTPAAFGKMADCHLQLATLQTNSYALAVELYQRVVDWPGADLSIRSKAAVGLGLSKLKLAALRSGPEAAALQREALDHFLDVAQGKLLRTGEAADVWWLKEAGREAGLVLEQQRKWREAAALYEQLARELPALKPAWEAKAAEARRRASAG